MQSTVDKQKLRRLVRQALETVASVCVVTMLITLSIALVSVLNHLTLPRRRSVVF